MKISFHGAARTVTGSKHLLSLKDGKKILLDCGMFQGMGKETGELNGHFGFDPMQVDALVLSHAHIDHSGLIPKLVKEGFKGPIFCTPATFALSKVLLEDSAKIQEEDLRYVNKQRERDERPAIKPLFDLEDVLASFTLFQCVEYGQWFSLFNGVQCLFTDAGHIIGSACVHLKITEDGKTKHLTFSGDVGRYRDIILRSPEPFPQADYIILESTYGNSLHEDVYNTPDQLLHWMEKTCLEKKGKLIIPAFSVGRTQEILFSLNQLAAEGRLPDLPFYVDSPMSMEATEVLKSFPAYFNKRVKTLLEHDDDPFDFPGLRFVKSVDESKSLNSNEHPMVIISASGMADAGRVKHHIANNIDDPKNTILIVGYCEPHSLGGRLMNGNKVVRIFGSMYNVNAEVGIIRSMSAHGDYDDLCQFLACQNPTEVTQLFIVHGEYDVQLEFQERLMKKKFRDVYIPYMHETVGLG